MSKFLPDWCVVDWVLLALILLDLAIAARLLAKGA